MAGDDALFAGPPSSLDAVLAAREARVARRAALLAQGAVALAASVVLPGPVKDCRLSRDVAAAADAALIAAFAAPAWRAERVFAAVGAAGPEALWRLDGDARDIKRATLAIEESHPLGRLFDLDVETREGPLSRATLGAPARACLVCGAPAHECGRSQRHDLAALRAEMARRHRAWEAAR